MTVPPYKNTLTIDLVLGGESYSACWVIQGDEPTEKDIATIMRAVADRARAKLFPQIKTVHE